MRIAIVDDSRLARLELKQQITNINQQSTGAKYEIVTEAANVSEALFALESQAIDLLLLDIDLPDGSGFDVLEQANKVPQTIFVSAYDEYAIKSFEYNALDYLMKPVRQNRLELALTKVKHDFIKTKLSPENRIFIKDRDQCFFVSIDQVLAFEALGNYTKVHLNDAAPCVYRPISNIHDRLDRQLFFKASRSWLINTHFIDKIESLENGSFCAHLQNGLEVTISKRQAVEFKRDWAL